MADAVNDNTYAKVSAANDPNAVAELTYSKTGDTLTVGDPFAIVGLEPAIVGGTSFPVVTLVYEKVA
jgi:methenyltetrahydromethanopterin cyclohydrolase